MPIRLLRSDIGVCVACRTLGDCPAGYIPNPTRMEKQFNALVVLYAQLRKEQHSVQLTSQQLSDGLQVLGRHLGLDVSLLENALEQISAPQVVSPEHVSTQWVADYLEIDRSNFYRNVRGILLFPVLKIGIRPYYLKSEVEGLMVRHEKGAHTWSKLAKLAKKKTALGKK